MNLPFTTEQFLGVFASYNHAVWPLQILLNILAIVVIVLAVKRVHFSGKWISSILGMLWLWTGLVYHMAFFAKINPAAFLFGALLVAGLVGTTVMLVTSWRTRKASAS